MKDNWFLFSSFSLEVDNFAKPFNKSQWEKKIRKYLPFQRIYVLAAHNLQKLLSGRFQLHFLWISFFLVSYANSQHKTFNAVQESSCGTHTREFYTFFMLTSCAPEFFSSNCQKAQLCRYRTELPKSASGMINTITGKGRALPWIPVIFLFPQCQAPQHAIHSCKF